MDSASKIAAEKNAYAFYVYSITADDVKNNEQEIDVALYKKDAPVRDFIISKAIAGQDAYEITSDAFKVMKPYQTIVFHGTFNDTSEISAAAQKYAIANDAHFYHFYPVLSSCLKELVKKLFRERYSCFKTLMQYPHKISVTNCFLIFIT